MKVAMLGWEFPPFIAGGLGVHCLELTKALSAQGIAVDFYMPRIEGRTDGIAMRHRHLDIKEVEADGQVDPYGGRRGFDRDFNAAVMRYNARLVEAYDSKADLLHCHDWITAPAALELKRRLGLPLVATIHSTEFDRSAGFYPQQWIADIERRLTHEADVVIAVSRYTRSILKREYDVPSDRVEAIHNGIDHAAFQPKIERDYNQPRGTVLFLSRLARQKGPIQFLEAARKVLEVRPKTGFIVAGTGDMLQECIDYTLDHGISDRVRFVGYVPEEELAATYHENELYVLPSVSEPFGISALEAMAGGVPTIVTRTSGVAEDARHALKVDHHDTDSLAELILSVLASPELREELGRNGSREARRFDWATTAQKTTKTYERALQKEMIQ